MRQLPVIQDRESLYWDDFKSRVTETVDCIKNNKPVPARRVAVFITNRCNFRCKYCNVAFNKESLSEEAFDNVVKKYGDTSIIHITGGEPSVVKWLYPYLTAHGDKYRFHLNTNAFIKPPYKSIKRLKVSLDSSDPVYWNDLVGHKGAFDNVVKHIKEAIPHTTTSITYTLNRQNYRDSVSFAKFVKKEFPGLYAVFFSVYKGTNVGFAWTKEDADDFFSNTLPLLKNELDEESLALICETIDEKIRLIQGVRFPENDKGQCYLSMSERVISPTGEEFMCSHLYRDKIMLKLPEKHEKCLYGCNRRLVQFNQEVKGKL
jgi:MoaA/NifB/PqqE/SkfB family radical SAM enzyme